MYNFAHFIPQIKDSKLEAEILNTEHPIPDGGGRGRRGRGHV